MKKSEELNEKLVKAIEKVEKIKNTIKRHEAQAEKKKALIISKGWNPDCDRYCRQGETPEEQDESYWLICEYDMKLEDIKTATQKLKDAEIILSNWKGKLEKQLEIEKTIAFEIPKIFIQCQEFLANEWTGYDVKFRDKMRENKEILSYEDFRKRYSWSTEDDYNKTNEEFLKVETRNAELWIIDLYNRVKDITGEVIDWNNISFSGKALAGIVIGENGIARVETIEAGGYNIQRFHLRTLVHEVK